MNAQALLKTWPGVEKANAETLLGFPSWRLETEYDGRAAVIRHGDVLSSTVDLAVTLDGESHRLRIGDSEAFADLHRLWARRTELPENLLLALIEKECGGVLQTLENVARKQLSVKGLATGEAGGDKPFVLCSEGIEIPFALDLSPALVIEWGRIDNLDVAHQSVRDLTRPIRVDYSTYDLSADETSRLAVGSVLVMSADAVPSWRLMVPSDDLVHVLSADETLVSFGSVADDEWPSVPAPDRLTIILRGRPYATAEIARLGAVPAVKLTSLL